MSRLRGLRYSPEVTQHNFLSFTVTPRSDPVWRHAPQLLLVSYRVLSCLRPLPLDSGGSFPCYLGPPSPGDPAPGLLFLCPVGLEEMVLIPVCQSPLLTLGMFLTSVVRGLARQSGDPEPLWVHGRRLAYMSPHLASLCSVDQIMGSILRHPVMGLGL